MEKLLSHARAHNKFVTARERSVSRGISGKELHTRTWRVMRKVSSLGGGDKFLSLFILIASEESDFSCRGCNFSFLARMVKIKDKYTSGAEWCEEVRAVSAVGDRSIFLFYLLKTRCLIQAPTEVKTLLKGTFIVLNGSSSYNSSLEALV